MATTFKFLRWNHEMDGRESSYIKEVLDWYRDEDAGDLKRSSRGEVKKVGKVR